MKIKHIIGIKLIKNSQKQNKQFLYFKQLTYCAAENTMMITRNTKQRF